MINRELAEKWIEALRSGKYPQTKGRLRSSLGFCCLGVLCDIVSPDKWTPNCNVLEMDNIGGELPRRISKKINLHPGQQSHLIGMNDSGDKSFNEIADQLEKWLKEDQRCSTQN